jgi:hypothetical protein
MKECLDSENCDTHYDTHIEEITRLQMLLKMEEQKLFKLNRSKKANESVRKVNEP